MWYLHVVSKRAIIWLAVLLSAALASGLVAGLTFGTQEPIYHGERLRYWLRPNDHVSEDEAKEAVRSIGAKGIIPILLRKLQARDSNLKKRLIELAESQNVLTIQMHPAKEQWNEAVVGFGLLGEKAAGAVPTLIELHERTNSPALHEQAARALGAIGPTAKAAIPALIRDMGDADAHVRFVAAAALVQIRSDTDLVAPYGIRGGGGIK
jgi:HEAT repeats